MQVEKEWWSQTLRFSIFLLFLSGALRQQNLPRIRGTSMGSLLQPWVAELQTPGKRGVYFRHWSF